MVRTSYGFASLSRESSQTWVLGANLSARSLYARLMAVFRRSLWRESDGRGPSRMTAADLAFADVQFEERDLIRFY